MMHIFDVCELSSYVNTNVYQWDVLVNVTNSNPTDYFYFFPESEVIEVYSQSFCFPSYLDPLLLFHDSKSTMYNYFLDLYKAITSINTKFA